MTTFCLFQSSVFEKFRYGYGFKLPYLATSSVAPAPCSAHARPCLDVTCLQFVVAPAGAAGPVWAVAARVNLLSLVPSGSARSKAFD